MLVFDGSGALLHRYLHGAGVDEVLAEEGSAGNLSWLLSDHQGSVRDVVDSSGISLDHIVYDSFGNVLGRAGTTTLRYAYTGRELDGESGLHFYRARYYDAGIGRFITQDPKGFNAGDSNLYRYVGNSTPNFRDPYGMEADHNQSPEWSDDLLYPGEVRSDGAVFLGYGAEGREIWELPPDGMVWMRNPFSTTGGGSWVPDPQRHWEDMQDARSQMQTMADSFRQQASDLQSAIDAAIPILSDIANSLHATRQAQIAERDLFSKRMDFALGYFWDAPKGIVKGAYETFTTNPVTTVKNMAAGLGQLFTDPVGVWNTMTQDSRSQGAALGSIAWGFAAGKGTSNVVGKAKSPKANVPGVSTNGPSFPNNPHALFPDDYPGLTKTVKPDGKIELEVKAGDKTYSVEYHPQHPGPDHFPGAHYHVYKMGEFPVPPKTTPNWFRLPNLSPSTPAKPGGGTFAPGDPLPTLNKAPTK